MKRIEFSKQTGEEKKVFQYDLGITALTLPVVSFMFEGGVKKQGEAIRSTITPKFRNSILRISKKILEYFFGGRKSGGCVMVASSVLKNLKYKNDKILIKQINEKIQLVTFQIGVQVRCN